MAPGWTLTRWPERETVDDWQQGVPLEEARRVTRYWRDSYDWRRCEAQLNGYDNFLAEIDGLDIHFMHVRSPHEDALPLILTHGWPGSIVEFLKVVEPLTNPTAHGGSAADAFHLVIPSLPGYGFSGKPSRHGWTVQRTANAWDALMKGLGYDRYIAQGGDWGSAVTSAMALQNPQSLLAIHLNMVVASPSPEQAADPTPREKELMERIGLWSKQGRGYSEEQSTKPQTLAYSLVDSPVGQAMWIYEKFHGWTDGDGSPADLFSLDEILDNIMIYWLTASGGSSARLYWESLGQLAPAKNPRFRSRSAIFRRRSCRESGAGRKTATKTSSIGARWNRAATSRRSNSPICSSPKCGWHLLPCAELSGRGRSGDHRIY